MYKPQEVPGKEVLPWGIALVTLLDVPPGCREHLPLVSPELALRRRGIPKGWTIPLERSLLFAIPEPSTFWRGEVL